MSRIKFLIMTLIVAAGSLMPFDGSAAGPPLRTEKADASEVKGTFTLILYGAGYSNDIETVAFLDLEGDGYAFEPYAPAFDYGVEKGVPAAEALAKAERFVRIHPSFHKSLLSKILDRKGNIAGYELRPLYFPLTFGVSDVLDIDYWPNDGKIKIIVRIVPSVQLILSGGGRTSDTNR